MAKRRRKPRKRTSRNVPAKGILREKADRLWSKAVIADWGRCAMSGKTESLEAHHLIPREYHAVRYSLRNGLCLTSYYHVFCYERAPHKNAQGFIQWLEDAYPHIAHWYFSTFDEVRQDQTPSIKTVQFYIDKIRELRQYVEPEDFTRIVGVRFADWLDSE